MRSDAPALLPILRSQHLAEILTLLLLHPDSEYSISEIASKLDLPLTTAQREVTRLSDAQLIRERRVGRSRLVSADPASRYTRPLTELVTLAFGPRPVIGEEFRLLDAIAIAIYGSWAARYLGVVGHVPRDVDVLVIGEVSAIRSVTMENARPQYDFFIAHATPDRGAAEQLFDLLKEHSKPFLDSRVVQLGDDWDRELARAQRQSRITVVLVSSRTGDAFYQREEIAAAIALARKDPESHRVVPVYLDANVEVPYGLRLKHSVHVSAALPLETVAQDLLELGPRKQPSRKIDYAELRFEGKLDGSDGEELFAVAFSPSGGIAAGSAGKILLWDRDRATEPRIIVHGSFVYSVAFSADGEWLASGGEDGTVRVYRVQDGSMRWKKRHAEAVYSVAFSCDGSQVASGGYDRMVQLWEARTGGRQPELHREGRITSVAFSPTEPGLLAIGDLDDTVTLWDGRDPHVLKGHTSSVETVAFSPDGQLLASAGLEQSRPRLGRVHAGAEMGGPGS